MSDTPEIEQAPDFLRGEPDPEQEAHMRAFRERIQFGVRLTAEELEQLAGDLLNQATAAADERARKRGGGPDVTLHTGPELLAAIKLAIDIRAISAAEARPMLRRLIGKRGKGPRRQAQPVQLRRRA